MPSRKIPVCQDDVMVSYIIRIIDYDKSRLERIEACNGSVDIFLKDSLGNYPYVEVQLWDRIQ